MTFDEFSRVAQEVFQGIPEVYREGIEGVTTMEAVETHPELPDVVTLGECLTQAYHSDWQGPETTRSQVVLYYGSFRQIAEDDPDFDWAGELRETLTHELKHHLESLADEDALEAMDYAMDQVFKREQDEPFDPWYFQWGEPLGENMYGVDDEVYIERALSVAEFDDLEEIHFNWKGHDYQIPRPEELGDVHFVVVEGIVEATDVYLQLVLIRRVPWRQKVKDALALRSEGPGRPEGLVVLESAAEARPVEPGGDL